MYCGMYLKYFFVVLRDSEIFKRSEVNNFKFEVLKKYEVSQSYKKCFEVEMVINNLNIIEMYNCCKQLYEMDDEKMEKKFKIVFYIVVLERLLDDYESFCVLQKLNGVEFG